MMKPVLRAIAILAWYVSSSVHALSLEITDTIPAVDYRTNRTCETCDKGTKAQPGYIKNNALGWHYKNPIVVKAKVKGAFAYGAYELKVKAPVRSRSGIKGFYAASVYLTNKKGNYVSAGSSGVVDGNENIVIPFVGEPSNLLIVLHTASKIVFIDNVEISFIGEINEQRLNSELFPTIDRVLANSEKNIAGISYDKLNNEKQHTVFSYCDAWSGLGSKGSEKCKEITGQEIPALRTIKSGDEYFVIKVENGRGEFGVLNNDLSCSQLEIMKIHPVIAADGEVVYDIVMPIKENFSPVIGDQKIQYYLFKIRLDKCPAPVKGSYELSYPGRPGFRLDVTVEQLEIQEKLYVNGWGYVRDEAIWNNPAALVDKIYRDGFNQFFVHQADIPYNTENTDKISKFKENVSLFEKNRGDVFLFLAWKPNRNLLINHLDGDYELNENGKVLLAGWLHLISSLMADIKEQGGDFYLYLSDEPNNKEFLKFVIKVASHIKSIDPSVKLYINPDLSGFSVYEQAGWLAEIYKYFDFVQFHDEYVEKHVSLVNDNYKGIVSVYSVPTYPPKSAVPFDEYKYPSWLSFLRDGVGVGVWSISNTSGMSQVSDIDGASPDWAMLYRIDENIYDSMRYLAFLDGVNDFKIFRSLNERFKCKEKIKLYLAHVLTKEYLPSYSYKKELYDVCLH